MPRRSNSDNHSWSTAYERMLRDLIEQEMSGFSGIEDLRVTHNCKMRGLSDYEQRGCYFESPISPRLPPGKLLKALVLHELPFEDQNKSEQEADGPPITLLVLMSRLYLDSTPL